MKHMQFVLLIFFSLILSACGGGGSSKPKNQAPIFASGNSVTINENTTVTDYVAMATDPNGDAITFSVSGGSDEALFVFDPTTGTLSFQTAPDFENPTDSDADNIYEIDISATDGTLTTVQNVTVTVKDVLEATVSSSGIKTIQFDWSVYEGATHYKLYVDPDGISGLSLLQDNLTGLSTTVELAVHKTDWINSRYVIAAFDATGELTQTLPIEITDLMLSSIGYFKASNTDSNDQFGFAISLSSDGKTLVVGAAQEDSAGSGINGDQSKNNFFWKVGAVYVFVLEGNNWVQQAYIKPSNPDSEDYFGASVSLSADGNTLVVGASGEDSNASGINGDQVNNLIRDSGAAYVFTREGNIWSQQAYVKASNPDTTDRFGGEVSISADGNTIAVGASWESSNAKGINGDQVNNLKGYAGAVYVYTSADGIWSQQAYIKASNTDSGDYFGISVSLSADGNILAVGATSEDSNSIGINGDQTNNLSPKSGAVYVFEREQNLWSQQTYVKASNTDAGDSFGYSVNLSADGNALVVSAPYEDSITNGINGDQANNLASSSGAAYIFKRVDTQWSQNAYIKASNNDTFDLFGGDISLSSDGKILAVGAHGENSFDIGIDGNQSDNSFPASGAVYLYSWSESNGWSQKSYIKASTVDEGDLFGSFLSLSPDGSTLAVGALCEDSAATGVNGEQADNSKQCSGAVYLY
ncbi:MAG: integrin [Gammaproteobacteria bacterium]|nr:integrin [Gammaproteobacteria bacterium]